MAFELVLNAFDDVVDTFRIDIELDGVLSSLRVEPIYARTVFPSKYGCDDYIIAVAAERNIYSLALRRKMIIFMIRFSFNCVQTHDSIVFAGVVRLNANDQTIAMANGNGFFLLLLNGSSERIEWLSFMVEDIYARN